MRESHTRPRNDFMPYALLLGVLGMLGVSYHMVLSRQAHPVVWAHRPVLWLLVLLLPLAVLQLRRRRPATMLFSRTDDLRATRKRLTHHLVHLPWALRLGALALLICALAQPQRETAEDAEVEGIDIVVALDVSESMSERDLTPDRLGAAKGVLTRFLAQRKSDRVGLVLFGREAYTQCPLTLDYQAITTLLSEVHVGLIDGRGTAIGNAIGTALNRLRKSQSKSRVIILLTDGDNNSGNLAPAQAARLAQALGIRIFTILMGRDAVAATRQPRSVLAPVPRYPVDPKLLETIAEQTGGTPYLATDAAALERRFQAILDELDRSRFKEQRTHKEELQHWFSLPALGLVMLAVALSLTRLRRFP